MNRRFTESQILAILKEAESILDAPGESSDFDGLVFEGFSSFRSSTTTSSPSDSDGITLKILTNFI